MHRVMGHVLDPNLGLQTDTHPPQSSVPLTPASLWPAQRLPPLQMLEKEVWGSAL